MNEYFLARDLIDTFKRLKQRIIWKYDEELNDVPSNVLVRKWLPQNDILTHPKIQLFISHGGLFSNMEAIKLGVPMLVIPFVGDQLRNAIRIESAGYGKYLDFNHLTDSKLYDAIEEMTTNHSYFKKAKEISTIFNENLVHPMDEFVWWIEHVIKFKGAKYLKSYAVNLSIFSYLLLDVLAATIFSILIAVLIVYFVFKKNFRRKNRNESTAKKQQ